MDVLVIGAGAVGLAVARALALHRHAVIVTEATGGIGNGISSRHSEVIHGGMYYRSNSLRARHCVTGRRMLYRFCESHGVPHAKCGKLIVATNDLEQPKIEGIYEQGLANGVKGLSFLTGEEARALEPNLACTGAVLSAHTGIIDSHALMLALQGDLEDAGGVIAFRAPVERISKSGTQWKVQVGGSEPTELTVHAVVNSAGLGAQALARATELLPRRARPASCTRQGQLLWLPGQTRLFPPDLSSPRRGRSRHTCDPRSCRAHAFRSRC